MRELRPAVQVSRCVTCEGAGRAEELERLRKAVEEVKAGVGASGAPFEWVDGPLITAMRQGDIILLDELNLAEDAVLERLNRQPHDSLPSPRSFWALFVVFHSEF